MFMDCPGNPNMPDLTKVYERDDTLFEALESIPLQKALECFKNNGASKTGQVMIQFMAKGGFLKTAIFDLCEVGNLYGVNIIFRSLIEHTLKAQFIFMKWVEEKTDQTAENYLKWYEASETYDYIKSWEAASKIMDQKKIHNKPDKILFDLRPEFNEKSLKEIKRIAAQFNYRRIIEYINEKISTDKNSEDFSFLLNIIPNYSELSGFVHGGPTADKEMLSYIKEEERDKKLLEIAHLAVTLAGSTAGFLTLALTSFDKSYKELFVKIHKSMNSI